MLRSIEPRHLRHNEMHKNTHSWSTKVGGDEGLYRPKWLIRVDDEPKQLRLSLKGENQICLTIGPVQAFISFYFKDPLLTSLEMNLLMNGGNQHWKKFEMVAMLLLLLLVDKYNNNQWCRALVHKTDQNRLL